MAIWIDLYMYRYMCHMKWLPNTELHVYLFISSFWKKNTNEMKNMKRTFNFHAHSLICKKIVADYLSPAGREIVLIRQGLKDPEGLSPSTWARDMFSTHRMLMIIFTAGSVRFLIDITWEIYTVFCYLCPICGLIVEILSDQCFFFLHIKARGNLAETLSWFCLRN